MRSEFHPTTKKNPFGNVLLTDIADAVKQSGDPILEQQFITKIDEMEQMDETEKLTFRSVFAFSV